MITTLEQALVRIAELESENKALREELERYKNITPAGRRKHNVPESLIRTASVNRRRFVKLTRDVAEKLAENYVKMLESLQ